MLKFNDERLKVICDEIAFLAVAESGPFAFSFIRDGVKHSVSISVESAIEASSSDVQVPPACISDPQSRCLVSRPIL